MVDRLAPDQNGERLYSVLKVSAPRSARTRKALIFEVIDIAATRGQGPFGSPHPNAGPIAQLV